MTLCKAQHAQRLAFMKGAHMISEFSRLKSWLSDDGFGEAGTKKRKKKRAIPYVISLFLFLSVSESFPATPPCSASSKQPYTQIPGKDSVRSDG
jgi:hypothetical protein